MSKYARPILVGFLLWLTVMTISLSNRLIRIEQAVTATRPAETGE